MSWYRDSIESALEDMDKDKVFQLADQMLKTYCVQAFIDDVVVEAMKMIGDKWEQGTVSLAQIYISGKICEELVDRIMPLEQLIPKATAKIAIATLEDYHVLGKRILTSVLKSNGYQFYDYGGGIDAKKLVEKIKTDKIKILLISVLMYPSAQKVIEVREELDRENYPLKILVGGAPFQFDPSLWKQVRADGMGKSATDALDYIKEWTKGGEQHG